MFPPVNISFTNDRYLRQSHQRRNPRSVSSDPRNNFATVSFPRPFPLCSPPTNFSTFRILAFLKSYTGPPPLPADISLAMPQQQDNWTQLIQIWSQALQEDEDELNTEQQPAGPPGGGYPDDPRSYGGYDPNAVPAQYGFPPTTNSGLNPTYDSSNVLPPNRAAVLNPRQKPAAPLRQTPGGLRGGVGRAPVANPNPNPRATGSTPRGGARRGGAANPTHRATAPSPGVLKASAGMGKR
jgi:hypothetical protein